MLSSRSANDGALSSVVFGFSSLDDPSPAALTASMVCRVSSVVFGFSSHDDTSPAALTASMVCRVSSVVFGFSSHDDTSPAALTASMVCRVSSVVFGFSSHDDTSPAALTASMVCRVSSVVFLGQTLDTATCDMSNRPPYTAARMLPLTSGFTSPHHAPPPTESSPTHVYSVCSVSHATSILMNTRPALLNS